MSLQQMCVRFSCPAEAMTLSSGVGDRICCIHKERNITSTCLLRYDHKVKFTNLLRGHSAAVLLTVPEVRGRHTCMCVDEDRALPAGSVQEGGG